MSFVNAPVGRSIARIVGFLVCVEVASGFLQGFYTPLWSDIANNLSIGDADVNWFEAAQLMLSALVVPLLARLGDMVGHRKVLLWSTVVTAAASWAVAFAPGFWTFLFAWALQGFYVVWLPLEVAIVYRRTNGDEGRTRAASGTLVFALEVAVIVAALLAGQFATALPMAGLLSIPAIAVTGAIAAVWFGVRDESAPAGGRVDWIGFAYITASLVTFMAGLMLVRTLGLASPWVWLLIGAGLALAVPFVRAELAAREPLVNLRILALGPQWPIQITAFLFGMSVLGAQIPLSTFARTDVAEYGFGLGLTAATTSLIIGGYVLSLAVGALIYPRVGRRIGTRSAMVGAAVLVAIGYGLFLPLHATLTQTLVNMVIAGIGSGALVAGLPAAAAAAAPADHVGLTTGMTNTIKTVGGAIASSAFAIALHQSAGADGHPLLGGYLVVWAICSVTMFAAALILAGTRNQAQH